MEVDGRCHCGKITYQGVVDPQKAGICHCTDCQTLSGAPYRVSVAAPRETFRLLSGAPKIYVKTADSGAKRTHAFCPDCGAPIYSSAISDPPVYNLRIGGLRQRADLPPRRQIWCDSALPWSANIERVLPRLARQ